jgi:hypothetical protein
VKYDDGFVAYLNGVEVLRQNLRDEELAFDSRANRHADEDALVFEEFDLSEYKNLLGEGTNVLAIRAINYSRTDRDMLILPALVSRLTLSRDNPAANVYYTTDGTDPRGPDGNPSPTAHRIEPDSTLSIEQNLRVIARNLDASGRGPESAIVRTDWSGPAAYDFVVAPSWLVISEINYHPLPPTAAERTAMPELTDESFEFIELFNPGPTTADLIGVELADGVIFDFHTADQTTIQPGERVLVVSNRSAFELRYGSDLPVIGQYGGVLSNAGEDIDLVDGTGAVQFTVNYGDNDPWPLRADGFGSTLELIDPEGLIPAEQSKYYSWRASTEVGGSPGSAGGGPLGVVINEVLANSRGPEGPTDSIELYNATEAPVDISGWHLSDSADDFFKYPIPDGTVLGAGQYVVYDESHFNADSLGDNGFALSGDQGDDVWLTVGDGAGAIRLIVDDVHFGATANQESLARVPNGSGRLAPARQNTWRGENGPPRVGPLVLSELAYHPGPPSEAALAVDPTLEDNDLEFVELYNPTIDAVDLTKWRIRGGVDFDFDAGTSLAAGASLVIVRFDPKDPENVNRLAAWKTHYSVADDVRILGGYAGQLNNSDDKVVLLRPAQPPADQPNFVPRVLEDEVLYDDLAPWPTDADGTGASLNRSALDGWGSSARSWTAATPSPGTLELAVAGDANGDGRFDDEDLLQVQQAGKYLTDEPATLADGDFNGDGVFDQLDIVYVLQRGGFAGRRFPARAALPFEPPGESPELAAVDDVFAVMSRR